MEAASPLRTSIVVAFLASSRILLRFWTRDVIIKNIECRGRVIVFLEEKLAESALTMME